MTKGKGGVDGGAEEVLYFSDALSPPVWGLGHIENLYASFYPFFFLFVLFCLASCLPRC